MYEIDFTESEKGRLDDTGLYTARLERMIEEADTLAASGQSGPSLDELFGED